MSIKKEKKLHVNRIDKNYKRLTNYSNIYAFIIIRISFRSSCNLNAASVSRDFKIGYRVTTTCANGSQRSSCIIFQTNEIFVY